jgi:DNA replication protein DnaC
MWSSTLIDEIGYLTLRPEQVNAFFKLMELRYARKTTILTTNLDYPDWYDLFKRKPLVDAPAILIMTTLHKVLDKNQARLYNTVGHS